MRTLTHSPVGCTGNRPDAVLRPPPVDELADLAAHLDLRRPLAGALERALCGRVDACRGLDRQGGQEGTTRLSLRERLRGVEGYVLKETATVELPLAISEILARGLFRSPRISAAYPSSGESRNSYQDGT